MRKQYGAGMEWSSHPANMDYMSNGHAGEVSCKSYEVNDSGSLIQNENYAPGELFVNKSTDEDGRVSYLFTDKQGRRVLTRQMCDGIAHDTYFVYDDYDQLRYVLPPAYQDTPNLSLYAYQYKYDDLNRCIEKKLPGCDPVYCIYDQKDQLVFSQDGVQRQKGEWTFYLYDTFQRLVVQGVCKNTNTASAANNSVECTLHYSNNAIVADGLGKSGYSSSFSLTSPVVHIVYYYDNYDFLSLPGFTDRTLYPVPSVSGVGLLTGKVLLLSSATKSSYIHSALYYDLKGRVVRSSEDNYRGGNETVLTEYRFAGAPKKITYIHTVPKKATQKEVYTYTYDHAERLTKVTHKLNDSPSVVLVEHTYDDLGRLSSKRHHANDALKMTYTYNIRNWLTQISSNKFNQKLLYAEGNNPQYGGNISRMGWSNSKLSVNEFYDFSYDELNRLTDAKYSVLLGFGSSSYDTSYSYNKMGGIVSLQRKGYMDFMPLVGATIDDLTLEYTGNRLKRISDAAGSDPLHQGAFSFIDGTNKPVEYDYDANGNMTKDLNKQISLIEYNSQNLPSRISINDSCRIGYAYGADGVKHHQEHYTNRNMIVIPDPGTGFEVNSGGSKSPSSTSSVSSSTGNGLPDYPSFDIGDMVPAYAKDYTSTDYCGNVIYESGVLARILTGEGYITLSNDSVIYHYFLTDHLGNNRVVMKQNGVVEQVNEYYPFGGLQGKNSNDGVQPNKFGGKELDRMYGLDLYDFVARPYDPGWGGFITMDPLCEKYPWVSPYAYCMNNPMNYKDPTGMWIQYNDNTGNYRYNNGQWERYETEGEHMGEYVAYTPASGSFLEGVLNGLNELNKNRVGHRLIGFFANDDNNATIIQATNNRDGNQADILDSATGLIKLKANFEGSEIMTEDGIQKSPFWLDIGHELSHRKDVITNGAIQAGKSWLTDPNGNIIPQTEIYATNLENYMRAAVGMPLRTHYAVQGKSGWEPSRLIKSHTRISIYNKLPVKIGNKSYRGVPVYYR